MVELQHSSTSPNYSCPVDAPLLANSTDPKSYGLLGELTFESNVIHIALTLTTPAPPSPYGLKLYPDWPPWPNSLMYTFLVEAKSPKEKAPAETYYSEKVSGEGGNGRGIFLYLRLLKLQENCPSGNKVVIHVKLLNIRSKEKLEDTSAQDLPVQNVELEWGPETVCEYYNEDISILDNASKKAHADGEI